MRRSQVCRDGQTVQEKLPEDSEAKAKARNPGSGQASQVYTECGYDKKVSGPYHGRPSVSVQGTLWRLLQKARSLIFSPTILDESYYPGDDSICSPGEDHPSHPDQADQD